MTGSEFYSSYSVVALIIWSGFAVVGFVLSRLFKRYDVADMLWTVGIVLAPILLIYMYVPSLSFKSMYLLGLLLLWGVRLCGYIGLRMRRYSEDRRYTAWRREWGKSEAWRSFLQVFCLQPPFLLVLVAPLAYAIAANEQTWSVIDFWGMVIFVFGWLFETVADAQLYRFKSHPGSKGRVMNRGLWAFSQHPNYFGEIMVWLGFGLLSYKSAGYWAVISPLLITYILVELTGVKMKRRFISEYRGMTLYRKTVPVLVPLQKVFVYQCIGALVVLLLIDSVWLHVSGDFYWAQMGHLAAVKDGSWHVQPWAFISCYIFIAVGLVYFAVRRHVGASFYRGGLFGLASYGIYDLVNVATLNGWTMSMVMVDVLWGAVLCSISAALIAKLIKNKSRLVSRHHDSRRRTRSDL